MFDVADASITPDQWATVAPLGPCVSNWARVNNLDVYWIIVDMMVRLIDKAQRLARGPRPVELLWAVLGDTAAATPDPEGHVDGRLPGIDLSWAIGAETRDEVYQRYMAEMATLLNAELDVMETQIRRGGGEPVEERRKVAKHMRWLARRVVGRETCGEIAEDEREAVTRRAVEKYTRSMADAIGFPLDRLRAPALRTYSELP